MNIVLSFCTLGNNSLLWGEGDRIPPFHYNSMSWASSSEKSDMELSEEESPPPSSCSFRASSVAYFWMYSEKNNRKGGGETDDNNTRQWIYQAVDET